MKKQYEPKFVGDAVSEKFELEVYECPKCGMHVGFDSSYLRNNHIAAFCPSNSCTYLFEGEEME